MTNSYEPLAQNSITLPESPALGFPGAGSNKASLISRFLTSKRPRRHVALFTIAVFSALVTLSLVYVDRYTEYELPIPDISDINLPSYILPSKYTDALYGKRDHPLYGIISTAEQEWKAKLARQSITLYDAVVEYRRRYDREPPLGFERWWAYTRAHNVQLPDEYDTIDQSIRPFLAFSPDYFRARLEAARRQPDIYVLQVKNGRLQEPITNWKSIDENSAGDRVRGQVRGIAKIQHLLEDFEAVWNPHDGPRVMAKYEDLQAALQSGRAEYAGEDAASYNPSWGFLAACPPSDSANGSIAPHTPASGFSPNSYSTGYLVDPVLSYSPCNDPALLLKHGTFASFNPSTSQLFPIFSMSTHALSSDIMGIGYSHDQYAPDVPWEEKTVGKAVWRGSATGGYYSNFGEWRWSQRFRLARLGRGKKDGVSELRKEHTEEEMWVPVRHVPEEGDTADDDTVGRTGGEDESTGLDEIVERVMMPDGTIVSMSRREAVDRYLDAGLIGEAFQCDEDDGTCADIAANTTFLPHISQLEQAHRKFVLDIDGNAWSARFRSLLESGSVVMKSTAIPEWYTGRIQPWVHYVPLSLEYAEMWDVMAFFTEGGDAGVQGSAHGGIGAGGEGGEEGGNEQDVAAVEREGESSMENGEEDSGRDIDPTSNTRRRYLPASNHVSDRAFTTDPNILPSSSTSAPSLRHPPTNDALARKIAEAGKAYTETFWRPEDIAAYDFRLYLEYARLGKRADEGDYVYDARHEGLELVMDPEAKEDLE